MITKIIVYLDTMVICYLFEPILHLLQRMIRKDNFWYAQYFLGFVNCVFIIIAVILMSNKALFWSGFIVFFVSFVMMIGTSQTIWKFVVHKANKPYKRSELQKERDRGVYFALRGKINPAIINLRHARLAMCINVIFATLCWIGVSSLVGDKYRALNAFVVIIWWYTVAITIWIYMRSCTPINPDNKQRKNKYITSIFL